MTIDARSHHYHESNAVRQNWSIDRWCRGLGINRQKMEQHPYICDVQTLLMFDEHQQHMSQIDKQIWTHCWQWSYHRQLPLSGYHRRKLISILDHIELRHTRQYHIQKRLQKRSAVSEIGKRSHDNDDKGLRSLRSVNTDAEQ